MGLQCASSASAKPRLLSRRLPSPPTTATRQLASPHRRSAVPTYPPHGLDVFPKHAAEGSSTTRTASRPQLVPVFLAGPSHRSHPPPVHHGQASTGSPQPFSLRASQSLSTLAAICIISIMTVINIGNTISAMPLDCAMRATPTPGTSTPTSHRALRDRGGPRDYFTLGHNNLTVTSSVNR